MRVHCCMIADRCCEIKTDKCFIAEWEGCRGEGETGKLPVRVGGHLSQAPIKYPAKEHFTRFIAIFLPPHHALSGYTHTHAHHSRKRKQLAQLLGRRHNFCCCWEAEKLQLEWLSVPTPQQQDDFNENLPPLLYPFTDTVNYFFLKAFSCMEQLVQITFYEKSNKTLCVDARSVFNQEELYHNLKIQRRTTTCLEKTWSQKMKIWPLL